MLRISDASFNKYGEVIKDSLFHDLSLKLIYETPLKEGVIYKADCEVFSSMKSYVSTKYFAEMPVQIGYCNGYNSSVDALEYHKSSEVIVAATDLILVLGLRSDIDDGYDISKAESFLMKAGEVVEIYGPTLHYCPIMVNEEGFKAAIILHEGTNTESKNSFAKNKWLYAHPDSEEAKGKISGYLKGPKMTL